LRRGTGEGSTKNGPVHSKTPKIKEPQEAGVTQKTREGRQKLGEIPGPKLCSPPPYTNLKLPEDKKKKRKKKLSDSYTKAH